MARKAFGTIVKSGGSSGTAVGELYRCKPPGLTVDIEETTHHGQADRFRTYLSTLGDWGEMEFEAAFSAATYTQLQTALFDDTVSWFVSLPFATPITLTFTGMLTAIEPGEMTTDGKMMVRGKVKPSGNITPGGV